MIIQEISKNDAYTFIWHRDNDQPAVIWSDGYQAWWQHGLYEREKDKPTILSANGEESWGDNLVNRINKSGG